MADTIHAYRVLRAQLGREPTYVELLRTLGHDPVGEPVLAASDPGYPAHPGMASMLLGPVEADAGLSALLEERSLLESHPELAEMRDELVRRLLFGIDAGGGLPGGPRGFLGLGGPGGGGGPPIPIKQIGSRAPLSPPFPP